MNIDSLHHSVAGVYAIRNRATGCHYVGSAVSIKRRMRDHFSKLRIGIHENKHLQHSFLKHGEGVFFAEVLEIVPDKAQLTAREQFFMDSTNPKYNILRTARSALGFKHSKEECLRIGKMSASRWAAMANEEKEALLEGFTMRGKVHSQETKDLMSAERLGKKKSEHHRSACSAAWANPENAEKYARVRSMAVASRIKTYTVTDPQGLEREVLNLSKFCKEHGLLQSHMTAVASGKRPHHKGWTCRHKDKLCVSF